MGWIIAVFVVIIVTGVAYSAWTSGRAFGGVEFEIAAPSSSVSHALMELYGGRGAKSAARTALKGIRIESLDDAGDGLFKLTYVTTIGDSGEVKVKPSDSNAATSIVEARALQLFRGKKKRANYKTGFYQLVEALTGLMMKMLFIRPNAPRIMRFQNSLSKKVHKKLGLPVPA